MTGNSVPIEAQLIKNQEIEAGKDAINLTSKEVAKSCILKLCNNDPNSISHYFDIFDTVKPVMTANERIICW